MSSAAGSLSVGPMESLAKLFGKIDAFFFNSFDQGYMTEVTTEIRLRLLFSLVLEFRNASMRGLAK